MCMNLQESGTRNRKGRKTPWLNMKDAVEVVNESQELHWMLSGDMVGPGRGFGL